LEALHRPLSLPYWPMRICGAVIQAFVSSVLCSRQHALDSRHITGELVSNYHPPLGTMLAVQQVT
jgi:hypothetical protein